MCCGRIWQRSLFELLEGLVSLLLRLTNCPPTAGTSPLEDYHQPTHTDPSTLMLSSVEDLKGTFPGFFNTISLTLSEYHILVDHNVTQVQHGHKQKNANEVWGVIEAQLQKIVSKGIITPEVMKYLSGSKVFSIWMHLMDCVKYT